MKAKENPKAWLQEVLDKARTLASEGGSRITNEEARAIIEEARASGIAEQDISSAFAGDVTTLAAYQANR